MRGGRRRTEKSLLLQRQFQEWHAPTDDFREGNLIMERIQNGCQGSDPDNPNYGTNSKNYGTLSLTIPVTHTHKTKIHLH